MTALGQRSIRVALALVVALGVVGSGAASAGRDAKTTGAPLKLMTVYEGSGPTATPEVPEGAIAAAKAINAKGGVNGRPIQIIACSTKSDPTTATGCGRKAVSQGVVAMVGNLTLFGGQFMPLMAQRRIPSIGLQLNTGADFTSPASFPVAGGAPVVFAGLASALAEAGAKKIVLARVDIPAAAALAPFVNAGLKRFGITARDLPVPLGAPDMSPYAAAALKDGTDGIVITETDQDAVNFIEAVRQVNPNVKIALGANLLSNVLKALGSNAEGILLSAANTTALKNTTERQFEKDMKAAGYFNFADFRLVSYASVFIFRTMAQRLAKITAPAVFNALGKAQSIPTGVTPPLQFRKGGVAGVPRVFNPCMFATRLKGGVQVPVTGKFENVFTGKACVTPR